MTFDATGVEDVTPRFYFAFHKNLDEKGRVAEGSS
jgi:hypothetical protein